MNFLFKLKKTIFISIVAIILTAVALLMITDFHKVDLSIPITYHDDAKEVFSYIKGFLRNDTSANLYAPFGYDTPEKSPPLSLVTPLFYPLCLALIKIISMGTDDIVKVVNYYYLFSFFLNTLFFIFALKHFKISTSICVVFGLLYAFLPYHFLQGINHFWVMSYYNVPLMVLILLWLWSEKPIFFKRKNQGYGLDLFHYRSLVSLIVLSFFLYTTPYYSFFFAFLALVSGTGAALLRKNLYHFISAILVILLVFYSLTKNNIPEKLYAVTHQTEFQQIQEKNALVKPGQMISNYGQDEPYGLKIVQLLLPVKGHRCTELNRLTEIYENASPHIINENASAGLGIIGSMGFLFLIFILLFNHGYLSFFRNVSVLNISALLLATVGGFSSLISTLLMRFLPESFPLIQARAYNRISVFIACFSFFTLAFLLDQFKRKIDLTTCRLTLPKRIGIQALFILLLTVLLLSGLYDQTTENFKFTSNYESRRIKYESDKNFFHQIETVSGSHSAIFQLPFTIHHMGKKLGIPDSDGYTGYIHSNTLKWTYGADKLSHQAAWYELVAQKAPAELLRILFIEKFSGILIDRLGYPDRGQQIEAQLMQLLTTPPLISQNQRYSYYNIRNHPLKETTTELKNTVLSWWKEGFYDQEDFPGHTFHWCNSQGTLLLQNYSDITRSIHLSMEIGWLSKPGTVTIKGDSFTDNIKANEGWQQYGRMVTLKPGEQITLTFLSDSPPRETSIEDTRFLVFAVSNLTFNEFDKTLSNVLEKYNGISTKLFQLPVDMNLPYGTFHNLQGDDPIINSHEWRSYIKKQPMDKLLKILFLENFSGLLIHRSISGDDISTLEHNISEILKNPPIISHDTNYSFFDFKKSDLNFCASKMDTASGSWQPTKDNNPGALKNNAVSIKAQTPLDDVYVMWGKGFYNLEQQGNRQWRWCSGTGEFQIKNYSCTPLNLHLTMEIGWLSETGDVIIKDGNTSDTMSADHKWRTYQQNVILKPGEGKILHFFSNAAPIPQSAIETSEKRRLVFAVSNFTILRKLKYKGK